MIELKAAGLLVRRGDRRLLHVPTFMLGNLALTMIVGPNGAGKSTLLRVLADVLSPDEGIVTLDGVALRTLPALERKARIGFLPQQREIAWPMPVRDVVALGTGAYSAQGMSAAAERTVDAAIASCDLALLADRRTDKLSGGESSRVHLARLLATQADILLADEPLTGLDIRHQWMFLEHLRHGLGDGRRALITVHDLDVAARFADAVIVMSGGEIVSTGPAPAALTPETIHSVFGIYGEVTGDESGPALRLRGRV